MPDEFVSDTCLYAVVGAAAFLGTQHILILYINTSWPVGVWFGVGERLGRGVCDSVFSRTWFCLLKQHSVLHLFSRGSETKHRIANISVLLSRWRSSYDNKFDGYFNGSHKKHHLWFTYDVGDYGR